MEIEEGRKRERERESERTLKAVRSLKLSRQR